MHYRIVLAVLAASATASAADPVEIIGRLLEAQRLNADRVEPYTYTEESVHFNYAGDGSLRRGVSETREVIFVEGLPFHKLVARNDKPLPAKEQKEIEKSVRQTAEDRRRQPRPPEGGQMVMGDQRIDLGATRELLTMFDNRLRGEEELRGHKAWVIESTPKAGYSGRSEHDMEVLSFRRTLWVDEATLNVVRMELAVIGEGIRFAAPGSTVTVDYDEIAPGVWLQTSVVLDVWRPAGKVFKPWKRTEYSSSNFHKFDVQSTVTVVDH